MGACEQVSEHTECESSWPKRKWTWCHTTDDSATKASCGTGSSPLVSGLNSRETTNTTAAQHRDGEVERLTGGKVGQHWTGEACPDCPLMVAEAGCGRPHFRRKPFREIARVLPVDCVEESTLHDEGAGHNRVGISKQIKRRHERADCGRNDHRPSPVEDKPRRARAKRDGSLPRDHACRLQHLPSATNGDFGASPP
jgi:hypothetical protein